MDAAPQATQDPSAAASGRRRERVRVLVADDHPAFRLGVVAVLRTFPEIEVVGDAADGEEALALTRELRPAVLLLDVEMPRIDGLRVVSIVEPDQLSPRTIVLSGYVTPAIAHDALARGARGLLLKTAGPEQMRDAVVAVAAGRTVIDPDVQDLLAQEIRVRRDHNHALLSEREAEVLRLVAQGLSVAQIGEQLHLSAPTIKTHLHHLYEKLGVSERAAAVAAAMRRGLLE